MVSCVMIGGLCCAGRLSGALPGTIERIVDHARRIHVADW
jgi:hypothetical protein